MYRLYGQCENDFSFQFFKVFKFSRAHNLKPHPHFLQAMRYVKYNVLKHDKNQ